MWSINAMLFNVSISFIRILLFWEWNSLNQPAESHSLILPETWKAHWVSHFSKYFQLGTSHCTKQSKWFASRSEAWQPLHPCSWIQATTAQRQSRNILRWWTVNFWRSWYTKKTLNFIITSFKAISPLQVEWETFFDWLKWTLREYKTVIFLRSIGKYKIWQRLGRIHSQNWMSINLRKRILNKMHSQKVTNQCFRWIDVINSFVLLCGHL